LGPHSPKTGTTPPLELGFIYVTKLHTGKVGS
jgi:hypothetical protein